MHLHKCLFLMDYFSPHSSPWSMQPSLDEATMHPAFPDMALFSIQKLGISFWFLDAWLDHGPPYCWKSWRNWTYCLCYMDKSISSCLKWNRHTKAHASRQHWTHHTHPQVFLSWESQMWRLGTSVTSSALSCLCMVQVSLFPTTAHSGVTAAFSGRTDVSYSLCYPASKGA